MLLNFDFDLPCRTLPRRCSRVLLVVGAVFLSKETCIKIPKGKNVLSHLNINDNSKEIMESFYLFTFLLDNT